MEVKQGSRKRKAAKRVRGFNLSNSTKSNLTYQIAKASNEILNDSIHTQILKEAFHQYMGDRNATGEYAYSIYPKISKVSIKNNELVFFSGLYSNRKNRSKIDGYGHKIEAGSFPVKIGIPNYIDVLLKWMDIKGILVEDPRAVAVSIQKQWAEYGRPARYMLKNFHKEEEVKTILRHAVKRATTNVIFKGKFKEEIVFDLLVRG